MRLFLEFKNKLVASISVFITTFVVYLPALKNGFLNWDDYTYIVHNQDITSMGGDFFEWAFFYFHVSNWHPLTWVSHAVDYAFWGGDPAGHHFTSILLHGINSALVTLLNFQLIECYMRKQGDVNVLSDKAILRAGIISGLFFGLHPIHVESAVWISERKDVLCALFFLLGIIFYVRYAYNAKFGAGGQRIRWLTDKHYLLALGFFYMAVLSKPMAITLPLVLCILDWYPLERWQSETFKRLVFEKLPFLVISLDLAITTILAQSYNFALKSSVDFPLDKRLLVGFWALMQYIANLIWPFSLSPFYPFPDTVSFFSVKYGLSFFFVVFFVLGLILKRNKLWRSVWLYYLITLLPVLGIVKVGAIAMADRYMYLPSISIFFLAGLLLVRGVERLQIFKNKFVVFCGIACILSILVLMSFLTVRQIGIWKDSITFWKYTVERLRETGEQYDRNAFDVYYNLSGAYSDVGRYDDAIHELKVNAYRANPNSIHLYNALGIIYQKTGRYEEAIGAYKTAITIYPFDSMLRNNLSVAYIKNKQIDKALEELYQALKINPVSFFTHNNLGLVYLEQGKFSEAIEKFELTLKLKPDYVQARDHLVEARIKLGLAYAKDKKFANAENAFNQAISADPNNKKLLEYKVKKHLESIETIKLPK